MSSQLRQEKQALTSTNMNDDLLGLEIRFWREMIESLDGTKHSRESMERMRQALALAEYRLLAGGLAQRH
jgi:hypothetical protein